jgi:hypothetical protein
MDILKANLPYGPSFQPVGKAQLYARYVDADGAPVLDADDNEQVVALQTRNGKLQVDSSFVAGVATGGLATTLADDTKGYEVNMLANKLIKFSVGTTQYWRLIASNTADTVTFATIAPAAVVADIEYEII